MTTENFSEKPNDFFFARDNKLDKRIAQFILEQNIIDASSLEDPVKLRALIESGVHTFIHRKLSKDEARDAKLVLELQKVGVNLKEGLMEDIENNLKEQLKIQK